MTSSSSNPNVRRYVALGVALVAIVGTILYLQSLKVSRGNSEPVVTLSSVTRTDDFESKARKFEAAKEFVSPDGYLNTDGQEIKLAELVGKKVILLDFWTYSCINCQRTLPYLTRWYDKYKDQGLVIVGVHTPEFEFEKDIENVRAATEKYGVKYPVVQDNEYATWDAYNNRYWPTHYLIDINGLVVDTKIGEGRYEETEKKIQELLRERSEALGEDVEIPGGFVDVSQVVQSKSPETYFGWSRNELLANGKAQSPGEQTLSLPSSTELNKLYLSGTWDFDGEYAEAVTAGNRIKFKYNARNVYFVASSETGTSVTILRDGIPVGDHAGEDVREDGTVLIQGADLYKLIEEESAGEHTIEIIVNGSGLQAFTFTFG